MIFYPDFNSYFNRSFKHAFLQHTKLKYEYLLQGSQIDKDIIVLLLLITKLNNLM